MEENKHTKNPHGEEASAIEKLGQKLDEGIHNVLRSENFKNWLSTASRHYLQYYSFKNAFLIYTQKPEASYVMGYEGWKDFGRQVSKGEKAIEIFSPIMAYEKYHGALFKNIKWNLEEQFKKNSSIERAEYRLGFSNFKITRKNQNKDLYGLLIKDKEVGLLTEEQLKAFIKNKIINQVVMGYNVANVFDVSQTIQPEYLYVKSGKYQTNEIASEQDGRTSNGKQKLVKIINTEERKARFKPNLDLSIMEKEPQKMKLLYDCLKEISERNGVPVYEVERNEDKTLAKGADGYFSREFADERSTNGKGFIVLPSDLQQTRAVTVLMHEIAHSDLHGNLAKLANEMKIDEKEIDGSMKEIQAESTAYIVAQHFGLETETSSFQYLAAYTNGFELQDLKKSLEVIYQESKSILLEVEKELEKRGYNLDLSEKEKNTLTQEEKSTLAKHYVEYMLINEDKNETILTELPHLFELNKNSNEKTDILIMQAKSIEKQEKELGEIQSLILDFEKSEKRTIQDEIISKLEATKRRIEGEKEKFEKLTESFVEIASKDELDGFKAFRAKPVTYLKEMIKENPELGRLSDKQIQYIAKSKFVCENYGRLLDTDKNKFVSKVMERANQIDNVISKNGQFVEINFCEQWFDNPIFKSGEMLHPKIANIIVKQAEEQIGQIKLKYENAEKDEYIPYSKCHFTIYDFNKKNVVAYSDRMDIGDGGQKSFSDFLHQTVKEGDLLELFDKSLNEQKSKNKRYFEPEIEKENPVIKEGYESTKEGAQEENAENMESYRTQIKEEKAISDSITEVSKTLNKNYQAEHNK